MKKFLTLSVLLLAMLSSKAQIDLEGQINELSKALPSYFLGYSQIISRDIGMPMAHASQSQHWKKNWRVKYGLSIAAQTYEVNNYTNGRIENDVLYKSPSLSYMGSLSNAFGSADESAIRFYLLNSENEKIINPKTGNFIYTDIQMPGGYGSEAGLVPFISPNLEIRIWKGFSISASYMPLSWFMREFEQENFQLNASFYSIGGGINFRNFTKIPVLSWLRFDASYGALNVTLNEFQDVLDFGNADIFSLKFNSMEISNSIDYLQYRGSIAIPVIKKAVIIAQAGSISSNFDYRFNYDLDVNIDAEKIKEDYNVEFDSEELNVSTNFSHSEQLQQNFYYGAGVLFDARVATFYVGYANLNTHTFVLKTSLRLL